MNTQKGQRSMATFLHLTTCLPFHSIVLFGQIKMPSQKRNKSHPQQHNSVLRIFKFWLAAGNLFEAHKQFTQLTLLPVWVRQLHLLTFTHIRDAFACSVSCSLPLIMPWPHLWSPARLHSTAAGAGVDQKSHLTLTRPRRHHRIGNRKRSSDVYVQTEAMVLRGFENDR